MNDKKTVPLTMNLGGTWHIVGDAEVEVSENGTVTLEGRITNEHVSELLTGEPKMNPLFKTAPFSILETS